MKVEIDNVVNTMTHEELKAEYRLVCAELHTALDEVEDMKTQMFDLDETVSKHPKTLADYFKAIFGNTSSPATA